MLKVFFVSIFLLGSLVTAPLVFGGEDKCSLKLKSSFKVNQYSDGLSLLNDIQELDYLSDRAELNALLLLFAEAPKETKQALLQEVVNRYRSSSREELAYGVSKRRIYQQILATIHNPYEIYHENPQQNARVFLDEFLQQRGADYRSKDIQPLIEAFQEKIKMAKAAGLSVDRVVLTGSLTSGLLKKGSDLDFIVDPPIPIPMTKRNPFEGENWSLLIEEKLKAQRSKLGKIDFARTVALHPNALGFLSVGTKLMIEIKEDGVFLLLYPPIGRSRLPVGAFYERVPLNF